jgi:hypothetical protein
VITRLNYKNLYDVVEFLARAKDVFEDFYVTQNKQRIFIKDLKVIDKILRKQQVYAVIEKEITALMIIYREKGFRPYVKILTIKNNCINDLLRVLHWNFNETLFIKVKKSNPVGRIAVYKNKSGFPIYGFEFCGSRGQEILLIKNKKLGDKKNEFNYSKD